MKKLLFILSLLLVIGAESAFTQTIQTVNGWQYLGTSASWTDSVRTRSFINGEGQSFGTYGVTNHDGGVWGIQTNWTKVFYPNLITPDTVSIEAKFVGGEIAKVSRISMRIAVQYGDFLWALLIDKTIPMDSQWVTLSWDMAHTRDFGIKLISRFYLAFQFYSNDSSYVGGDIVVRNLEGRPRGKVNNIDFSIITAVPESRQIPSVFVLEQNYPNPFNPSTTIRFSVPKREQVNLTVFNFLGQEVRTLVNEVKEQGIYEARFDASNLPSGTYFYKLQIGASMEVKKMVLLK